MQTFEFMALTFLAVYNIITLL